MLRTILLMVAILHTEVYMTMISALMVRQI